MSDFVKAAEAGDLEPGKSLQTESGLTLCDGFVSLASLQQELGGSVPRRRELWIDANRLTESRDGFIIPLQLLANRPEDEIADP